MLLILKKTVLIFIFFSLFLFISVTNIADATRLPNIYAFYQQKFFDTGCHIFPRFNYSLLQKYKERQVNDEPLLREDDFISTAWAIPSISTSLEVFFRTFDSLLEERGPFSQYYDRLIQDFVGLKKYTDSNGSLYHNVWFFRPVTKFMRALHAPYQCYDLHEEIHINVPTPCYLSQEGRILRLQNVASRQAEVLHELPEHTNNIIATFNNCPVKFYVNSHQMRGKMPRNVGLFEFILFMNGLDKNNNLITEDHELFLAYRNFRKAIIQTEEDLRSPGSHPYSEPLPDLMLESVIAKILSQEQTLKDKFLGTIDFCLTPWEHYQNVYHPSYPGRKAKEFMPSENLMLAFYISQSARFLYASATSNDAFLQVIEVDDSRLVRFLQSTWGCRMFPNAKKMCQEAERVRDLQIHGHLQRVSFLDAWEELVPLVTRTGTTAFHSFDSHGSVKVFNEDSIPHEFTQSPTVGRRLHMHVIDSSYAKTIGGWYTRTGKEEDFLPEII